nr:T9SS type A sorting domain-containing protein [Bacteroidia bacterium]
AIIIELSTYDLNTKLTIFNVQGKLVFEGSLINKLNKVETNLTKGYYLYRITSEDQVLKKDKLIIE